MDQGFDHMTIVVSDLDEARRFFGVLGFAERLAVAVSGDTMERFMGIDGWEADHVTLVHTEAPVHQEVQLLRFHHPTPRQDDGAGTLDRMGFNHVCFRVADVEATLARFLSAGFRARNEVMDFHDRRLVFVEGPGLVVELAQWTGSQPGQGGHLG